MSVMLSGVISEVERTTDSYSLIISGVHAERMDQSSSLQVISRLDKTKETTREMRLYV